MSFEELKQVQKPPLGKIVIFPKRRQAHAIVCFQVESEGTLYHFNTALSFLEPKTGDDNCSLLVSLTNIGKANAGAMGIKAESAVIRSIDITGYSDEEEG